MCAFHERDHIVYCLFDRLGMTVGVLAIEEIATGFSGIGIYHGEDELIVIVVLLVQVECAKDGLTANDLHIPGIPTVQSKGIGQQEVISILELVVDDIQIMLFHGKYLHLLLRL